MKKKILIIVLISVSIVVGGILAFFLYTKEDNNKDKDFDKARLKELYDNSYEYYKLLNGEICNKENINVISIKEQDVDIEYCLVESKINTINKMQDLVNKTFTTKRRMTFFNKLTEERRFIEYQDKLYVKYDKICSNIDLKLEDVSVSIIDSKTATIGNVEKVIVYAFKENGKWYLDAPLHLCSKE